MQSKSAYTWRTPQVSSISIFAFKLNGTRVVYSYTYKGSRLSIVLPENADIRGLKGRVTGASIS